MSNIAEFTILGRVGKVKEFQGKTNLTICANYPFKDKDGTKENPHWNEISVFTESTRGYIKSYCQPGDLVMARGRIKQNSFEKDGQKIYSVDLIATEFSILAHKVEKQDNAVPAAVSEARPKKRNVRK